MLEAVMYGQLQMQVVFKALDELAKEVGTPAWDWKPAVANVELEQRVKQTAFSELNAAYQVREKLVRQQQVKLVRDRVVAELCNDEAQSPYKESLVDSHFHELEAEVVRKRIIAGELRIDGRDTTTVRPITIRVGVLPRVHGSAIFTRGETQALVVTTLGNERDAQMVEDLQGDYRQEFMLHYNFPPYSVGEVGFMSGPKRREIGHGKLAKRALEAVVPGLVKFHYVVRVVSEI